MTLYRKVCKSPVFGMDNEFGDLSPFQEVYSYVLSKIFVFTLGNIC